VSHGSLSFKIVLGEARATRVTITAGPASALLTPRADVRARAQLADGALRAALRGWLDLLARIDRARLFALLNNAAALKVPPVPAQSRLPPSPSGPPKAGGRRARAARPE
jgi:hypothetical protein